MVRFHAQDIDNFLVFFFEKQDQNLVLRKSRLINGVAPDTSEILFPEFSERLTFLTGVLRDLRERKIPFGVWNRNVDDLYLELSECALGLAVMILRLWLLSWWCYCHQNGSIVSSVVSASRP
ncbi:hypothetical protein TNCV_1397181 [Trichonephila clavipes]|nr:hypothetical protein TNCV_1397181 [Trichonephila clavipes]